MADDAWAIYWNPAGLAFQDGSEVRAALIFAFVNKVGGSRQASAFTGYMMTGGAVVSVKILAFVRYRRRGLLTS